MHTRTDTLTANGSIAGVDPEALRAEVRIKYAEVATNPDGEFYFTTGRPLATKLGYPTHVIDALPDSAMASFAGVALADRDADRVGEAADTLAAAGHTAIGVRCDVSIEADVAALVHTTVSELGGLDMAFNNAGIMTPPADAADENIEVFERVQAVNLRGIWACMKHELAHMRTQAAAPS